MSGPTLHVLVTCSLDRTRGAVLEQVIANLHPAANPNPPRQWIDDLLVFDNASTVPGTVESLAAAFPRVFSSDRNVGLWSAIDWALAEHERILGRAYEYVYVIESDMIHYAMSKLSDAERLLHDNPELGGVRCQEYSVAESRLYDKDRPINGSRRWAWQSHTHRFTGEKIWCEPCLRGPTGTCTTNFLTQLPALNRIHAVKKSFEQLRELEQFSEPDFQRAYFDQYPLNGLIDGGIYHSGLSAQGTGTITGSWSSHAEMLSVGYRATRVDRIEKPHSYNVKLVEHCCVGA